MIFDLYYVLLGLGSLIVLSYIYNIVANRTRIPSAVLLLLTGILLNYIGRYFGVVLNETNFYLELIGALGLIFIVLEGALDLKITQDRKLFIIQSFSSAFFVLAATSITIALILAKLLSLPIFTALIYALPLAIVSSAIAIPSAHSLPQEKKEFIIYETTFSDILGILAFQYLITSETIAIWSLGQIALDILLMGAIALASCIFLIYLMNHIKTELKLLLILAIVINVYTLSKIFHLPALLLILIFGLFLNNFSQLRKFIPEYFHFEKITDIAEELKNLTIEFSFLLRTFFFILFGYTLNLASFGNQAVLEIGLLIMTAIILIRFVVLKFILKIHIFPEVFIAPRGLVTIILFYNIPQALSSPLFQEGIVYFVIIASSLLLTAGLTLTKEKYIEDKKMFVGN